MRAASRQPAAMTSRGLARRKISAAAIERTGSMAANEDAGIR
jgi:hypothetical protein